MKKPDFQDHYEILGVSMKATSEEIANAYQALAREFHPNTPRTGDRAKFAKINAAYEALSDPATRKEFDRLFENATPEHRAPGFSGPSFFTSMQQEGRLRLAVLCVLYDHRRHNALRPSLTFRELEGLLTLSSDQLNFSLWFLKQRGLAVVDDKSSVQITVDGMEYLEQASPEPAEVLPLIRAAD
ncbi:MAG: DnaJ domain-containing protein [Solibacteraceae bacterium]|nr:DnaJ domain-containing protein [Solibacteraceae bacterium]